MKRSKAQEKSPQRRNRLQILQLLKEFERQNLTVSQFCKLHHLHPSNFYHFKKRYGSAHAQNSQPNGFLAVELAPSSDPPASLQTPALFAEVNGIRLYQPVSALYLKTLLP